MFSETNQFLNELGVLGKKRLQFLVLTPWIYLYDPGILSVHSAFNARDLDSWPQEMGSGLLVVFPQSSPSDCPLMHAEMLTEIGNTEAGN